MNYQFAIKDPLSLRLYSPVQATGFRFAELAPGEQSVLTGLNKDFNHLLFVLEGELQISCNEFIDYRILTGQFVLIPIAADVVSRVIESPCRILLFSFEKFFHISEHEYIRELGTIVTTTAHTFIPGVVRPPLDMFLNHLNMYFKLGMNKPLMHEIKHIELSAIFRAFYSKEEVAQTFYPMIGRYLNFRIDVLRNYRKVSHIDELADLFGLEKRTFGRQFKEEFNSSPYRWILNQKAKHIQFCLAETGRSLDEIRREYGFKFPGHFTRFCREQFNVTPTKLARSLRTAKKMANSIQK
ncbi:MAG: helix-turn-helix transcriptional regulator [Tannerellaceae bacterium]|jgi:AraC-like DNA-binding protein|nr:helix-turn-helix transcriptional regulator [Tannerellaceae bacterium]